MHNSTDTSIIVLAIYLIRRELAHYATTRQQYLISPAHASLAQARTVLITNVPFEMCDEQALRRWASFVPGGVQNVWVYRDTRVRAAWCWGVDVC